MATEKRDRGGAHVGPQPGLVRQPATGLPSELPLSLGGLTRQENLKCENKKFPQKNLRADVVVLVAQEESGGSG